MGAMDAPGRGPANERATRGWPFVRRRSRLDRRAGYAL